MAIEHESRAPPCRVQENQLASQNLDFASLLPDHRTKSGGYGAMKNRSLVCVLAVALAVQGCSSRPRAFSPMLATPPASTAELDAAAAECSRLLVAGKLDKDGRLASAGGAAATGAGVAVAGTTTAVAIAGYSGLAVLGATVVLLPFAIVGGAWGTARMKRAKKEAAIKAAMAGCLNERGYQVVGWQKAGRKAAKPAAKRG